MSFRFRSFSDICFFSVRRRPLSLFVVFLGGGAPSVLLYYFGFPSVVLGFCQMFRVSAGCFWSLAHCSHSWSTASNLCLLFSIFAYCSQFLPAAPIPVSYFHFLTAAFNSCSLFSIPVLCFQSPYCFQSCLPSAVLPFPCCFASPCSPLLSLSSSTSKPLTSAYLLPSLVLLFSCFSRHFPRPLFLSSIFHVFC